MSKSRIQALVMVAVGWSMASFDAAIFAEPKVTTVLGGMNNPCAVVVQPEIGHVFVSDSGSGQIVRIVDGKANAVIVGFKSETYGMGQQYKIGPLGLLFLGKDTLVVGGGDLPDGEEKLRTFAVPVVGTAAIQADAATSSFELKPTTELKGEGNFYALAATSDALFVTCNGDDTKGWVSKAARKGNTLTSFDRFLPTKEAVQVDAPVGLTISRRGELVVGQMGELDVPRDALLTFFGARDGKKLMSLATGLYDITALAYSPKGQLFALDFAWMKADEGGLFQLVAVQKNGQQVLEARKILALDKPTAMAFAPDGALYVTVFGSAPEGSDKRPGSLLKIELTH